MKIIIKRKRKIKKPKEIFPKETEAAWFVLKEFIDPLTCSEKHNGTPLPMNKQVALEHLYSGTTIYKNITESKTITYNLITYNFSKGRLHDHLTQETVYYYRSKRCAKHAEGYGGWDSQALKLPFSEELDICHKRHEYDKFYVLLDGLDVDAHNGETDAEAVGNWIKRDYLHDTYWEPSTGGKGRHGYYIVAYPKYLSLVYVKEILTEVHKLLNMKREQLGFESKVGWDWLLLSVQIGNSVSVSRLYP